MGIQTLAVELAATKAWQAYRGTDGVVKHERQLMERLRRYLASRDTANSGSDLATDGLVFLKRLNRPNAKLTRKVRSIFP
jgi:hypothetical protein